MTFVLVAPRATLMVSTEATPTWNWTPALAVKVLPPAIAWLELGLRCDRVDLPAERLKLLVEETALVVADRARL
jgi:hypothetical protein